MDSIKTLSLAILAALTAMGFLGSASAMAERTTLCAADEGFCDPGNVITHVHEVSEFKGRLLSSFTTVECDVLFLGDIVLGTEAPLVISGSFTYSNCSNNCTVKEENGPAEIKVLREATERASVTGEGLVHVSCSFLNCRYNGVGLKGSAFGALLTGGRTGLVGISEQTINKESGTLCPSTAKLDLTTNPLITTYISS